MKFFILSPCVSGHIDHVLQSQLLRFLPLSSASAADFIVVPISFPPNFVVNPALYRISKPIVLIDMSENGWEWDQETNNVLGTGITDGRFAHLSGSAWEEFDRFVRDHQPVIQFKRELKLSDKAPRLMPIEHLCYTDPLPPVVSKQDFDARPIEIAHVWGHSHPSRVTLHADIFRAMANMGISVISNLGHFDAHLKHEPNPRTWASIYTPWFSRSPMADVFRLYSRSKICVSLWGAGKKCFRSAEIVNSTMALPFDELAWSFPWLHRQNCIRINSRNAFGDLEYATCHPDLYDIYVAGQENLDRYRAPRYISEYFIPSVEAVA